MDYVIFSFMLVHIVSIVLALHQLRRRRYHAPVESITIIRPMKGIDRGFLKCVSSGYKIPDDVKQIFCVSDPGDLVIRVLRNYDKQILIGDDHKFANPKLSNLEKGFITVDTKYTAFVDSNVIIPRGYLNDVGACLNLPGVGMVSAPPIGVDPENGFADVECAFLNTYQARWQYAADALGMAFAQGKNLIFPTNIVQRLLERLDMEPAEDAAFTKIMHSLNLRIKLLYNPPKHPVGYRSLTELWDRQVRWARLRRATFFWTFLPEIFMGFVPVFLSMLCSGWNALQILVYGLVWYAMEFMMAVVCSWEFDFQSAIIRDVMLPFIWIAGWGSKFKWQGNERTVKPIVDRRVS